VKAPTDLESLESKVFADIEADRGPVARLRSLPRGTRFALLVALVAAEAAIFWFLLRRGNFAAYPAGRMALTLGGYATVLLGASWLALRPIYLPDRRLLRVAFVLLGLALPVVIALLPEVDGPPLGRDAHVQQALFCFANGVLVAAAVLVLAWLLDRGAGAGPLLAAVAGGLTGTLLLHVHCPYNQPLHLLAGHATVPVVVIVFGFLLRRSRN
jgi:hypothetical protein